MSKKAIVVPVLVIGIAAGLLFTIEGCWNSWESGASEQRTDDACVRADMTPMSTRISGTVKRIDVQDFETVKPSQLLVELDDADYRAVLAEAEAGLAAAEAEYQNNQAAKSIQDAKIQNAETVVNQAAAAVEAARAGVEAVRPDVKRAEIEKKRQESLFASRATTHQVLEVAVADADRFAGLLATREADLQRAQDALSSGRALLEAEKRERTALDTRDSLFTANIQAKQAAIIVAKVNLGYTRIAAPAAGAIGERHVQAGQLVVPGMQLVDLVEGDVWIQANYKETQLRNIRGGDAADVSVDSFPGVVLHGKVVEIAPASGSQFALLPPDNATGNFTKVVQRVPVKIALDPGHALRGRLRPGFSVVVTIHASGGNSKAEGTQS